MLKQGPYIMPLEWVAFFKTIWLVCGTLFAALLVDAIDYYYLEDEKLGYKTFSLRNHGR